MLWLLYVIAGLAVAGIIYLRRHGYE